MAVFNIAKAQSVSYTWDNSATTCTWTVNFYDQTMTLNHTFTMTAGATGSSSGCVPLPPMTNVFYMEFISGAVTYGPNAACASGTGCAPTSLTACGGATPTNTITVTWAGFPLCTPSPSQLYSIVCTP